LPPPYDTGGEYRATAGKARKHGLLRVGGDGGTPTFSSLPSLLLLAFLTRERERETGEKGEGKSQVGALRVARDPRAGNEEVRDGPGKSPRRPEDLSLSLSRARFFSLFLYPFGLATLSDNCQNWPATAYFGLPNIV